MNKHEFIEWVKEFPNDIEVFGSTKEYLDGRFGADFHIETRRETKEDKLLKELSSLEKQIEDIRLKLFMSKYPF